MVKNADVNSVICCCFFFCIFKVKLISIIHSILSSEKYAANYLSEKETEKDIGMHCTEVHCIALCTDIELVYIV